MAEWRPLDTLPREGRFLLAVYAPTSWAYWVSTVDLRAEESERSRAMKLRYARAWMPLPEPPQPEPIDV